MSTREDGQIRRVVTRVDGSGRSVVDSDEYVQPTMVELLPGAPIWTLWGRDEPVNLRTLGGSSNALTYFPPTGGFRFGVFTVAPDSAMAQRDVDMVDALKEAEAKLPGLFENMDRRGIHATQTVDMGYVICGEPVLVLDNGVEVPLAQGDCFVQYGARHGWRNRGADSALLLVLMLGADSDD